MLLFNITGVSEGIDTITDGHSRDCIICHFRYYSKHDQLWKSKKWLNDFNAGKTSFI